MNKVSGLKSDFSYVKEEGTRIVIGYGLEEAENDLWTWYEVYLPKKQINQISIDSVKEAIITDINSRTDEKILSGFIWNNVHVWLSSENQRNFSEAQRMSAANVNILPITFKLGETENGQPVYHTFNTVEELNNFYLHAFAYINACLNEGW